MPPDDDYIVVDFGPPGSDDDPADYADSGAAPAAGPAFADSTESDAEAPGAPVPGPVTGKPSRGPEVMPIKEAAPEEYDPLAFDWLTEAAIPAGIFGLLGCLLYFLIDLRAALGGEFSNGLRWVCFWFLLASILITRIRTKYGGATLALPYVLGLAGATSVFIWHFTLFSGAIAERFSAWGQLMSLAFNYALVGLIWWGAYKVTRECTLEENVGHSLNQGFFADLFGGRREGKVVEGRHPGRVILFVSIIAVIVFGLGARRLGDDGRFSSHAFWCMAGFVFFALYLLALTNLSAIRMDVRSRRVTMARSLTPTWIIASLALVLFIVALSSVLPRTHGGPSGAIELGARAAWLREAGPGGLDQGPSAGLAPPAPDSSTAPGRIAEATGDGAPTDQGESGESGSGGKQGQQSSVGQSGDAASGSGQGQGGGASAGQSDSNDGGGSQSQQPSGGKSQSSGQAQSSSQAASSSQQQSQDSASASEQGEGGEQGAAAQSNQQQQKENEGGTRFPWWLWLLLALLLALIIYLLIRNREKIMPFLRTLWAPFAAMWAALLAFLERLRNMLGFRSRKRDDEFADLPEDPFADIWGQRELYAGMTPAQIVRHVYRAFLAFCSLRGFGRDDAQTEYEFLRRLPPRLGIEEPDQRNVTGAYVFATYSPAQVRQTDVDQVRDIWTRLRPAIDTALAAQAAEPKPRRRRAVATP